MRHLRFGLTDAAILIAIVGLTCAVPLHFRRYVDRDECRWRGDWYFARGEELVAMAEHPEPWIDPFRDDFRRLSAWQMEKGRRLLGSRHYDEEAEQRRIVAAGMDGYEVAFKNLFKQFEALAARHGYRRPQIAIRYYPRHEIGAFFTGWPLYAGMILLGGLLAIRWRRSSPRPPPAKEAWRRRLTNGTWCLLCGEAAFFFSAAWAAIGGGSPGPAGADPWPYILAGMFDLTDGHGILSVLGVLAFILGIAIFASEIREWWRRRRIDASTLATGKRADSPDFPRSYDPASSD